MELGKDSRCAKVDTDCDEFFGAFIIEEADGPEAGSGPVRKSVTVHCTDYDWL